LLGRETKKVLLVFRRRRVIGWKEGAMINTDRSETGRS